MNTKIILGCILSLFLLLTVPVIPAVHLNTVKTTQSTLLNSANTLESQSEIEEKLMQLSLLLQRATNEIKNIDAKAAQKKLEHLNAFPLVENLKEKIGNLDIYQTLDELKGILTDDNREPQCYPGFYLIILLVSLVIIFRLSAVIFGLFSLIIGTLLAMFTEGIAALIGLILDLIGGGAGFIVWFFTKLYEFIGGVSGLLLEIITVIYKWFFPTIAVG